MFDASKLIMTTAVAVCISAALFSAQARVMIQNKGSDTLVNVAQAWAEAYQKVNADVAVAVTGGGSGTGIAALINGTVDLANSSRSMSQKEIDLARSKGHNPKEHVVGHDALAVYLHKGNPAQALTIAQLAEIYGEGGRITKWTDLGITVPDCRGQKIVVVSRQNNSGTYEYFREAVLGAKRDFRMGTLDMHGSKDVVDLVEKTSCAIGYSGLAYATEKAKLACVGAASGGPCVMPSVKTAVDRSYPIARPLFMYTNGEPSGAVKQYLDWILSDEGQCIISKIGYAPTRNILCR
jgi:phosphate transport system substrate-binding protein